MVPLSLVVGRKCASGSLPVHPCLMSGPLRGKLPETFSLPNGKSVILFDGVYALKEGSNLRL